LDIKIVTNQRKYTNDSAKREAEFVAMLDELKHDLSNSNERKMMVRPLIRKPATKDTIVLAMDKVPPAPVETINIPDNKILKKIEMMKKKIKNDAH
jgi:hypothetical protein